VGRAVNEDSGPLDLSVATPVSAGDILVHECSGSLPVTFTAGEAHQAGVHSRELYRWRDGGDLVELSRGVFRRADAAAPT
jgi:hypothetical protein